MTIEIHGREGCPFAWRVRLVASEKGVPFTFIAFDKTPPDAGAERNPDRRSPLLIDGDFVLVESMVIANYLEEAFVGPPLSPAELRARARMRLAQTQLEKLGADARPGAVLENKDRERVVGALETLEKLLADNAFLGGTAPSLADLQIWPMLAGLFITLELPVPGGRVGDYWQRVRLRPSYQATRPRWA